VRLTSGGDQREGGGKEAGAPTSICEISHSVWGALPVFKLGGERGEGFEKGKRGEAGPEIPEGWRRFMGGGDLNGQPVV